MARDQARSQEWLGWLEKLRAQCLWADGMAVISDPTIARLYEDPSTPAECVRALWFLRRSIIYNSTTLRPANFPAGGMEAPHDQTEE